MATEPQIAIEEYDPVAFFTENKVMPGTDEYTFTYHDMGCYFSSQKNRDLFVADPRVSPPI